MIQQGIQKLKCQREDHQDEIDNVCYNQFCTEFRLNCFKCIKKGIHHTHFEDVEKTNSLIEYIENKNKECDSLINYLNNQQENINQSFCQFKKGIRNKYFLQQERFVYLNQQQINDFLNSTIKLTEYKQSITAIISDQIKKLTLTFSNLYDQLKRYFIKYFYQYLTQQRYHSLIIIRQMIIILNCHKNYINKFQIYIKMINLMNQQNYQINKFNEILITFRLYGAKANLQESQVNTRMQSLSVTKYQLSILDMFLLYLEKIQDCQINVRMQSLGMTKLQLSILDICQKGACLRLLKQFKGSLKYLDQALSINSNHTFSLLVKGQLLEDQNKDKEALICYVNVLKIQPNDQWIQNQKAVCERKLKK